MHLRKLLALFRPKGLLGTLTRKEKLHLSVLLCAAYLFKMNVLGNTVCSIQVCFGVMIRCLESSNDIYKKADIFNLIKLPQLGKKVKNGFMAKKYLPQYNIPTTCATCSEFKGVFTCIFFLK